MEHDITDGLQWVAKREQHYLAQSIVEITEERYYDMLNVLPPKGWTHKDGVERFSMIEHEISDITSQFAKRNDRYFHKYVRWGDPSTYITSSLVDTCAIIDAPREDN